uniref:Uncharacterized protein n=1 Tax=Anopheles arabiensis TaxID=7173 RepID=A0A182I5D6_ANOAR
MCDIYGVDCSDKLNQIDQDGDQEENYTTVSINVRDVNDNPPVFEKSSYRLKITEDDDRGLPKRILRVCLFTIQLKATN